MQSAALELCCLDSVLVDDNVDDVVGCAVLRFCLCVAVSFQFALACFGLLAVLLFLLAFLLTHSNSCL